MKIILFITIITVPLLEINCCDNICDYNDFEDVKWYGQLTGGTLIQSVLKPDSTVWSWGFNGFGTLGNGSSLNSEYPVMAKNIRGIISIDQSYGAEVALDRKGNIWFWGNLWIYNGEPDTDTNTVLPIKLGYLSRAVSISMVNVFIFLLTEDGDVWNMKLDRYTPTIVSGLEKLDGISKITFLNKNYALTKEGKIYDLLSKKIIQDGQYNFISISGMDGRHTIVLKDDGTVWAWGHNDLGQLGNGTFEDSSIPMRVLNLTNIISISANFDYNLALRNDGTVWFWGFTPREDNLYSQNIPVLLSNLENVVLINASENNLVMKSDGSYWTFSAAERIPRRVLF